MPIGLSGDAPAGQCTWPTDLGINIFLVSSACHPCIVDCRSSCAGHPCRRFTPKNTDRHLYWSIRSVPTGFARIYLTPLSVCPADYPFLLTARDTIASVPLTATAVEVDKIIARSVDELRFLWRKARESFKATVIQQTFLNFTEPIFGSYDRLVPGAPAQVIARLNDRLSEAAAQDAYASRCRPRR